MGDQNIFAAVLDKVRAANDALIADGVLPAGIDQSRIVVEPPRESAHGDMATNAAMVLAKGAASNPRALAEAIAAKLRADGFTVTTRVEFGSPNEYIVDVAREMKADLIAMSTHGSGGVSRVLMGSVATGVVQRANTPVLIVRPTEVREQEHGARAAAQPNTPPSGS